MHRVLLLLVLLPAWAAAQVPFAVEGFGRKATGGWQPGHTVMSVTSLADSGPGTLRAVLRRKASPRVVVFDVEGDIVAKSGIKVPSDTSIDGRGKRIRILGQGLQLVGVRNVIITSITIEDIKPARPGDNGGDGIGIIERDGQVSRDIVIDNVTLRQKDRRAGRADVVDEAISAVSGATDITIQWTRIENWEKAMLFGRDSRFNPKLDADMRITVHHNAFVKTARRNPRVHFGKFDIYNNVYLNWGAFYSFQSSITDSTWAAAQNRTYGILSLDKAKTFVEANFFEKRETNSDESFSWYDNATRCEPSFFNPGEQAAGFMVHEGNFISPRSIELKLGVGCLRHDWKRPYAAKVDVADERLRANVYGRAGDRLTR